MHVVPVADDTVSWTMVVMWTILHIVTGFVLEFMR